MLSFNFIISSELFFIFSFNNLFISSKEFFAEVIIKILLFNCLTSFSFLSFKLFIIFSNSVFSVLKFDISIFKLSISVLSELFSFCNVWILLFKTESLLLFKFSLFKLSLLL